MKIVSQKLMPLVAVLTLMVCSSCTTSVTPTNTNTASNTNTAANTNTATTVPVSGNNANSSNVTITLPLLDAMFADETFANDLKSRLQLTDQQVSNLRNVAREATSKLRESNESDSYTGTTSAARAQAEEQIRATIGPEKTQQLRAYVAERSSGASAGGAAQPAPSPISAMPADTRILVNAPAFRMDVFQNGQLVKTYRVSIGYPEFPLPTGMRKAEMIIFNPTWTPPDEPWVESPGSKVKVGETVKAGDKLNPLGPIKIPIGLPSLIHGGKTPAKIGNFGSHGCVGLTNKQVQDFAKMLAQMGGANLTDAQLVEYEKNKTETKSVKLPTAVPVELRYDTIRVEDGKLHIYRDVYDKDTNTEENLRAALQAYGIQLEQLSETERAQVMNALKEMSRDASGKADSSTGAASNSNANTKNANAGSTSKKADNPSGKVTRTIKGQKEIVVEIAALQGKGYPAPVNLDTGGAPPEGKQPASKKKR